MTQCRLFFSSSPTCAQHTATQHPTPPRAHSYPLYSISTPTPVVEITCYEYEGINAIKEALRAGAAVGDEKLPIKVCACGCSAATAARLCSAFRHL